ncbi:Pirin-like protein CC_3178 (modular protein) [Xanthomonas citri pv. bilvae]|nr:Pirin-like protein CC_3178 (modular protein) [Xanthomonas citri pv. bilvae]
MTTLIAPRVHDIGGLEVRRAVPTLQTRSVGPFVFVDHMGPAVLEPDHGIDVRPHPHIGLATVTFLWAGEIGHRDTLGSDQVIRPGDVNWMTAGRGIAHSERTPGPERAREHALHGMETWIALPRSAEETAPAFHHHAAARLPQQRRDGVWLRVIAGRAYGEESPVQVFSGTLNVALDLAPDAELDLDTGHTERALYILEGEAQLDGADVPARHLIVPSPGARGRLRAKTPLKAMLLGGSRWMGRVIYGGTSFPVPRNASSRPRTTGRPAASAAFPATTRSSFRCPSHQPRNRLITLETVRCASGLTRAITRSRNGSAKLHMRCQAHARHHLS